MALGVVSQPGPRFVSRIGLNLLDGGRHQLTEAISILERIPLHVAVGLLSAVNAHLWLSHQQVDVGLQRFWLRRLCTQEMLDQITARERAGQLVLPAVFFDDVQILSCLRLAVCHCRQRASLKRIPPPEEMGRAMLIINDHIEPAGGIEATDEWFVRRLFPGMLMTYPEPWLDAAVRWHLMIEDIPARFTEIRRVFDFGAAFKDATGQSLHTYRAFAFAATSAFHRAAERNVRGAQVNERTQSLRQPEPSISISLPTWLRRFRLRRCERAIQAMLWAEPSWFSAEIQRKAGESDSLLSLRPFRARPLLKIGSRAWCPSMRLLGDKSSHGVYHTIMTYLRSRSASVEQFQRARGLVFDVYVRELLVRAYEQHQRARLYFPERDWPSQDRRRCDALVLEDGIAVMMEFKSGMYSEKLAVKGDWDELQDYVNRNIVDAYDQIADTVEDLENGDRRAYDHGVRVAEIQAYFPVVVMLEVLPRMFPVARMINRSLDAIGRYDVSSKLRRLEIIDVRTLEYLEDSLLTGAAKLSGLLAKKLAGDQRGDTSFWDLSMANVRSAAPSQYIMSRFAKLGADTLSFWQRRQRRQ
jgi:hypothetical protein